jgi:tRNA modification GTPase
VNDTIAAIATPFGEGALAVLRLSGPQAIAIADGIFRAKVCASALAARVQQFGAIFDGEEKLDEVLLSVHRAPGSYTGEDLVEISCHGGVFVSRRLLELLLARGARSAGPGEFTQRAYLAGKLDLTQAEAVMDLISAQTELARRAATEQLSGRLGARLRSLRASLLELLAHLEASLDFPDEDLAPDTGSAVLARLDALQTDIAELLATADQGRVLREGVRTVIYGAPNVGKSSLLNVLLGDDRAIVSPLPGTTRDVIAEIINLRGIPLRLADTAGLRESVDELERAGMERTRREIERADLVLHVVDGSQPRPVANAETASSEILVINKADLGEDPTWAGVEGIRVSCLQEQGVEALADAIETRIWGGAVAHRDWSIAINARHAACLETALANLEAARKAFTSSLSPEYVVEDLRGALAAVGDVVGRADSEELLGEIFSRFCIGK